MSDRHYGMRLIDNLTAVTMDEQRRILTDAAIVIEQDRIVAVESTDKLRKHKNVPKSFVVNLD